MSRYARQASVIPDQVLQEMAPAIIVGVGAIGRQVALQLASAGVRRFILFDDDTVEDTNIVTQGYREADIGSHKVSIMARDIMGINSECSVTPVPKRYSMATAKAVIEPAIEHTFEHPWALFSCVDSISARRIIWNVTRDLQDQFPRFNVGFMADGRMTAESMRVIATTGLDDRYESTLFESGEAFTGPCTARGTLFCANVCAGLMVSAFTKYLRKMAFEGDSILNLFTTELTTTFWP